MRLRSRDTGRVAVCREYNAGSTERLGNKAIDHSELNGLYEWLSRFNLLVNLVRFGRLEADLTLHKSLRLPAELASEHAGTKTPLYVNDRALDASGLAPEPRVLDAGCGFGGTVFRWRERTGGTYDGLTRSRVQLRVARRAARRRGLASFCRFHLRSYDDPPAGPYDAVVSIEALIYSPCLERTFESLAAALEPGGKLVLVDDVLSEEAKADRDLETLRKCWRLTSPMSDATLEEGLHRNRLRLLHDEDLSERVVTRPAAELQRLEARYAAAHRRVPIAGARFVFEAFLGGLALERLYQKGLMRYRLLVARREV